MTDGTISSTLTAEPFTQVKGEEPPFTMKVLAQCTKDGPKSEVLIAPKLLGDESCITSTFREFARSPAHIVPFMKTLLVYVEELLKLENYHLKIVPSKSKHQLDAILDKSKSSQSELQKYAAAVGWQAYVFSDLNRVHEADHSMSNLNFDEPIKYKDGSGKTIELSLSANDLRISQPTKAGFQVFLDAQARPTYVVVCGPDFRLVGPDFQSRFARRQSQFSDDEIADFWRMAVDVVEAKHGSTNQPDKSSAADIQENQDLFEDMRLNAGTFQNVAHIHLKVKMSKKMFDDCWANSDTFRKLREENGILS